MRPCCKTRRPGKRKVYGREKAQTEKRLFGLAVRIGLVCVCIYLCVSLVFAQIDIVSKRQQLENLTQQVAAQEAANTELQRTLDSGDEAAYMERIARDKLGYVLPGEHIYVDMSGTELHRFGKHCGFAIFITLFNVRSYRNPWQ